MIHFVHPAAEAPAAAGAYALLVRLEKPLLAKAGRRDVLLCPGLYIYCGSARGPGGLRARIARHVRRNKKAHWHVDQLTLAGVVEGAFAQPGGDECALNASLSHLPAPLEGFGASDCPRCRSHLRFLPKGAALPSAMEHARKGLNPSLRSASPSREGRPLAAAGGANPFALNRNRGSALSSRGGRALTSNRLRVLKAANVERGNEA
jgi:histidyl-tRNA synthetase